mgnify:FL=1
MLYDNIMVPYDGSESAQAALAEAVRYAREDPGAALHIVQIVDTEQLVIEKLEKEGRNTPDELSSVLLHAHYDEALAEADAALRRQIGGLLKGLMNEITVDLLDETVPGEQIVAFADEHACDLIVMGSRGLGVLRGMLGSVSYGVLRSAEIPVLVAKKDEEG